MSETVELQAVIERIRQMEQYLDEVSAAVKMNSCFIHKDERMQVKIQELTDYFENGQWLQDYDCDARGKLPADLKRGVLSQDALYELLCELENER